MRGRAAATDECIGNTQEHPHSGRAHGAEEYPQPMQPAPLQDGHGRLIGDLRVSVTDRCNFRCQYCMPAEGLPWLERAEILSFEEITRLVGVMASMGVVDVRLTGGEPLVRRDFPVLAEMLTSLPAVREVSVTTNGFLLERDAERLVRAGDRSLQRLGRFAPARPLLRADPARRARSGPARDRDAGRLPRSASDQGQRGGDPRLHRGRGPARSPSSPAGPPTRSASSSSCRLTRIAPGRPTRC